MAAVESCDECSDPIDPGAEHYPDPASCPAGVAGFPTGTPPVHVECCPACLQPGHR